MASEKINRSELEGRLPMQSAFFCGQEKKGGAQMQKQVLERLVASAEDTA